MVELPAPPVEGGLVERVRRRRRRELPVAVRVVEGDLQRLARCLRAVALRHEERGAGTDRDLARVELDLGTVGTGTGTGQRPLPHRRQRDNSVHGGHRERSGESTSDGCGGRDSLQFTDFRRGGWCGVNVVQCARQPDPDGGVHQQVLDNAGCRALGVGEHGPRLVRVSRPVGSALHRFEQCSEPQQANAVLAPPQQCHALGIDRAGADPVEDVRRDAKLAEVASAAHRQVRCS